jgi:hypothetical protein
MRGTGDELRESYTQYSFETGNTYDVRNFHIYRSGEDYDTEWDPINGQDDQSDSYDDAPISISDPAGPEPAILLPPSDWSSLVSDIEGTFSDIRNGLITWVEKVYGDVQSGDLDTSELITPREMAAMTAEEEGINQALADLMALNYSVDLERQAEVRIPSKGATIYGTLAVTSPPAGGINAGDTIDPSATSEDYYLTYDESKGQGTWSDYEAGIDGGVITFTAEPYESTLYRITTVASETLELQKSDFAEGTDGSGNTVWTYDATSDLENAISEIDSVEYYSTQSETNYVTIQLTESFEVVTFSDSEGNNYDSADFSSSDTQTDNNYISQEEWQQFKEQQERLIEKYEESQNEGRGPILPDDLFSVNVGGNGMIGLVIVGGVVGLGVLSAINPFNN